MADQHLCGGAAASTVGSASTSVRRSTPSIDAVFPCCFPGPGRFRSYQQARDAVHFVDGMLHQCSGALQPDGGAAVGRAARSRPREA